jgi:YD repeat-containing protein
MPNGEELRTTDARRARLDRMVELERGLADAAGSEPQLAVLLQEYVDLAYLDARDQLGSEIVDSEEGRALITSIVGELLGEVGVAPAIRAPLLDRIEQRLAALSARPSRGVVSADPPAAQVQQGADPVMLFNGQLVLSEIDVRIDGAGIDFAFTRTYKNQAVYDGPLGFGWSHNYDLWLREAGDVIFRKTGDLREDAYVRHPLFGRVGFDYFVPPDGQDGVILEVGDSFVWRLPDGLTHRHVRDPARPFLHRLDRIEDRHGNQLRFSYDPDGRLAVVEVNHPDRVVRFAYDERGRIVELRDYAGRAWRYAYDDFGDLIAALSTAHRSTAASCSTT